MITPISRLFLRGLIIVLSVTFIEACSSTSTPSPENQTVQLSSQAENHLPQIVTFNHSNYSISCGSSRTLQHQIPQ